MADAVGTRVAVVGAGAVGTTIALRLVLDGFAVTIFERDLSGAPASFGNAGHIGAASIVPWANPSHRKMALSARADPTHPLRLRFGDMARHPAWIMRWLKASTSGRAEAGSQALKSIVGRALSDLEPLLDTTGTQGLIRRDGLLHVFASDRHYAAASAGFEQRKRHGIRVEHLSPGALADLEPALAIPNDGPRIRHAVLLPDVAQVLSPQRLVEAYRDHLMARGGTLRRRNVTAIEEDGAGATVVSDGERERFDKVVIAAGARSPSLVSGLSVRVPLIAERGYHLQFGAQGDLIRRSILFVDQRVVFSPSLSGLRLTTGAEFTHPARAPDYSYMRPIFDAARHLIPGVPTLDEAVPWAGDRPSTPDSLPVLGLAPRARHIVLAYGHGHSGVTLSAPTAVFVSALLRDQPLPFDPKPFRPDRPA